MLDRSLEHTLILSKVSQFDEICTYLIIDEIGGLTWSLNHEMADGRIDSSKHAEIDKELVLMREIQIHAIKCLTKFGVTPFKGDEKQATTEYWTWFRWWDAYVKNMPREQREELEDNDSANARS